MWCAKIRLCSPPHNGSAIPNYRQRTSCFVGDPPFSLSHKRLNGSIQSVMSLLVFNSLLLSLPSFAKSAPVVPTREPGWVSAPSGRGTFELVSSCVFTLVLCVWTALHLNVFPAGTSTSQRVLKKAMWALLALFAPEFVLWRAYSQWYVARQLYKERNKILDDLYEAQDANRGQGDTEERIPAEVSHRRRRDSETEREGKRWCLEHGFFAVMGGYSTLCLQRMKIGGS